MNIYCHLSQQNRWLKIKSAVDITRVHENALILSTTSYSDLLVTVGTKSPEEQQPAIYFFNGQALNPEDTFYEYD